MITDSICSWSCTWKFPLLNNCSASLCNSFNKIILNPFLICYSSLKRCLKSFLRIVLCKSKWNIRILSCAMISPYYYIFNIPSVRLNFISYLIFCTILIKSCQSSKVFSWDIRCKMSTNHCICICRISYYNHFHIFISIYIKRFPLPFKNFCILTKQIFSFHSRPSRFCSYQNSNLAIFKSIFIISSSFNFL